MSFSENCLAKPEEPNLMTGLRDTKVRNEASETTPQQESATLLRGAIYSGALGVSIVRNILAPEGLRKIMGAGFWLDGNYNSDYRRPD